MKYDHISSVRYKDVKISNISYQNVHNTMVYVMKNRHKGYICLNDVSNIIAATKDDQLKRAMNESLLSLADGMPLAWYARMVGCREIERISGVSLMKRLMEDMQGCKHYLLGDTEITISKVIAEAKKRNNSIKISGHSPPFKVFDEEDNKQMIERIRKADPDIIWVSFGGRKQEKWMNENIAFLDRGVMIGVGAAFRWFIGEIVTPPRIFQVLGLQWLFRLTDEFIKNPGTWLKIVRERELLSSKLEFVLKLTHEVKVARQQFKKISDGSSYPA